MAAPEIFKINQFNKNQNPHAWPGRITTPGKPDPILHDGDHVDAPTFLRRWERMPEVKHAELLDGRVILLMSPLSMHLGRPNFMLSHWLGGYVARTRGLIPGDGVTTVLDGRNVVRPDIQLNLLPSAGGRVTLDDRGYVQGPPDLVAEFACSSESQGLYEKFRIYENARIREYLVWRVQENRMDWRYDDGKGFMPIQPDATGVMSSRVFPGLCLQADLLLGGDLLGLHELIEAACKNNPAHEMLCKQARVP